MDGNEHAESARHWRLNSIQALQDVDLNERTAIDPDDLATIKAIKKEKERLIERENAVKARYNRLITNRRGQNYE